jgi:hypothetical protein
MAKKTLKITFNGICTLWPGPPRNGDKTPHEAFVIMPANPDSKDKWGRSANEWGAPVPEHFPFVHVAASALVKQPPPDAVFGAGGEHLIYFFPNARVRIDPGPEKEPLIYFTDPKRPLAERPGSDDVAPQDDIRWLADIRDVLADPPKLKPSSDPTSKSIGEEVAAIVNLVGGTLKANFPGDSVNAKTFVDVKGNVVPGLKRVLADEFTIEIPYAETIEQVTLIFENLRGRTKNLGKNLVLRWPDNETTLAIRMGNDPIDEMSRLDTESRFDPVRLVGPVLKPIDDDFDLHYNLMDIPKDARVLPQNDVQQCSTEGCKPKTG